MDESFDGDAISRADREFLASLGEHPLRRNPLYGTPCPPRPNFGPFDAKDPVQTAARLKFFDDVVTWMLANYAYREGAFMSKGGAISLVDGEIISLADLRGRMAPWALIHIGPRGGIKMRSPVEDWMLREDRHSIRREEMRPDQPRPTFTEDGYAIFNRYRPPAHPASGGEIATFEDLLRAARARRDGTEMAVALARAQGAPAVGADGRGDHGRRGLRLRPRDAVRHSRTRCSARPTSCRARSAELTGKSAVARFNARLADALFAVVNEAVDEDGHQQAQRRLAYEALKNAIDPSPTARRRFEEKDQHVYAQRSAMSAIIATQHRDVVKLPRDDRRFSVITCGGRDDGDADGGRSGPGWRSRRTSGRSIGRCWRRRRCRSTCSTRSTTPPPFAGRLEMIGMAKTAVEDAYEAAIEALEGFPLFTLTQSAAADRLLRRRLRQRGERARQAHRHQERLPAARAGRALQPHLVSEAAGDPLRPHGAGAAALAPRRQGDDRRGAQADGGADHARRQYWGRRRSGARSAAARRRRQRQ